ncbi:MAG: DUF4091 domain-containing protein [Limisphaera sp.]
MNLRAISSLFALPAVVLMIPAAWINAYAQAGDVRSSFGPRPLADLSSWRLEGGSGAHVEDPVVGRPVLMVEGKGEGGGFVIWTRALEGLQPGGLYQFQFRARRDAGTHGGCVVAGPRSVNRDFQVSPEWESYRFRFRVPDGPAAGPLRLGVWETTGRVFFEQPQLRRLQVLHEPTWLGQGEWVDATGYHFEPAYDQVGANYHRPLEFCSAAFNTDRWVFSGPGEVVYRFDAPPGQRQTAGRVSVEINYHQEGRLVIEAATEVQTWTPVGHLDRDRRSDTFALPTAMFPATAVRIRLRTLASDAFLQVHRFGYQAALDPPVGKPRTGRTHWILLDEAAWPVHVSLVSLGAGTSAGEIRASVAVQNPGPAAGSVRARFGSGSAVTGTDWMTIPPGHTVTCTVATVVMEPGQHLLPLQVEDPQGELQARADVEWTLGWLEDPRPGVPLAATGPLDLWWCESGWKIGRDRPPPTGPVRPVQVALARGEYEPVQLVLRPRQSMVLQRVLVAPMRSSESGALEQLLHRIHEVAYVKVHRPTDAASQAGEYPDPLPPLSLPLALEAGRNQPLWLTFYAPAGTPAGLWRGALSLVFDHGAVEVPLEVRVYDFALPRPARLRSAFGLNPHRIARYHGLTNAADRAQVYELYLQDFAEHRVSPYSFFHGSEIALRFEGPPADRRPVLDFQAFDRAAQRWLDSGAFNSFLLPLEGMGGGTFHSRHPGRLDGHLEGTPEHERLFRDYVAQVERHLRERGWLDRAYTYWFDEPEPKDYEFVVQGMQRIRAAAPGLRRMLTEPPEPELLGHVDIWCALTPEWTPARVAERRAAGEEVWWYLCTAPRAPYLGLFIDHPGTALRLWAWQSWQFGVQGILVWETTYWTSPTAFPDRLQNPWDDPMSYLSGYGHPPETRIPWGNGDGRFLYPPRRDPNRPGPPVIQGPIPSLRWENVRDGIEDYDYFWLLQQEIQRVEQLGDARARAAARTARRLLEIPESISRDQTRFTTDPRLLLQHRDAVARAIERLQRWR